MRHRIACGGAVALAVVATLGSSVPANAQARDTPRRDTVTSSQRIPVRKGTVPVTSRGEVSLPRDTMPVRRDSVVTRDTTISTVITRDSVVRAESTTVTTSTTTTVTETPSSPNLMRRFGSGFYMGIGAGASVPVSTLNSSGFNTGFAVQAPIGWNSATGPFGVRLNLGYDRLRGETVQSGTSTFTNADPSIWTVSLDATLRWPIAGSSGSHRAAFYLVGGGGMYHFRDINESVLSGTLRTDPGQPGTIAVSDESVTKWGVNGGLGFDFRVGNSALFVESRYINVFANNDRDLRFVPLTLGVKFF